MNAESALRALDLVGGSPVSLHRPRAVHGRDGRFPERTPCRSCKHRLSIGEDRALLRSKVPQGATTNDDVRKARRTRKKGTVMPCVLSVLSVRGWVPPCSAPRWLLTKDQVGASECDDDLMGIVATPSSMRTFGRSAGFAGDGLGASA